MPGRDAAIGIFDSGIGGLTVLRQISEQLPSEAIVYLGDTARVPYGTKSAETVTRYARGCARILLGRGIKLLVVACNTASAYALETLRSEIPVPVLGVIEPGAATAAAHTRSKRVGVIGTAGTVQSGVYPSVIQRLDPAIQVFCKACPLFVPLAEEGWTEGEAPRLIAGAYLEEIAALRVDTLVLGCTHYPLLKGVIAEVMGDQVTLIDSADATARAVRDILRGRNLTAESRDPQREFLVTDSPENFAGIGRRFLGYDIRAVEWVDVS